MTDPGLDAFLNGLLKYASYLPGDKEHPTEILVMRGHLLVEAELQHLVEHKLQQPEIVDLKRLGFRLVFQLARGLYGNAIAGWVWDAMAELNAIRNSLAHHLEDDMLAPRLARFSKPFKERDPKTFAYVGSSQPEQLAYCIAHLHSELLRVQHL